MNLCRLSFHKHLAKTEACSVVEEQLAARELRALAFLLPLSEDYPRIEEWFVNKVAPGLRNGTRHMTLTERHGEIVALGIAKDYGNEKKICTVRVAPSYEGRGMGVRVFDGLLNWLRVDDPHLTVSEHKLAKFERIFDYFGFAISSVRHGFYVPNRTEICYNEPSVSLPSSISETRLKLVDSLV